jgi:hypothetical protein
MPMITITEQRPAVKPSLITRRRVAQRPHLEVAPVGLEIDGEHLPELLAHDAEGLLENICDVILQHPAQVAVVLGVDRLDIRVLNRLVQHVLVHRLGEVRIEQLAATPVSVAPFHNVSAFDSRGADTLQMM